MLEIGDVVYNRLLLGNTEVLYVKDEMPILRNTEKVHSYPNYVQKVQLNPENTVCQSNDPLISQNRKGENKRLYKACMVYDKLTNCVCQVAEVKTFHLIIDSHYRSGLRSFCEVEAFQANYCNELLDHWIVKSYSDSNQITKVYPGDIVFDCVLNQTTELVKIRGNYAGTSVTLIVSGDLVRQPWELKGLEQKKTL